MGETPKQQLDQFIARFTPEIAKIAAASVRTLRQRYPTATVLVYDNYNALAIGFAPAERTSDAIFSIACYAKRVNLCFLLAGKTKLKDPHGLLEGEGKLNRFVPLEGAHTLDEPAVRDLMDQAAAGAPVPFPDSGKGPLVIKSISAKQRPRRPA
ncbi:MAG: hypothetical protein R3B49_10660 [Phycisphaerales bacterium]